MKRRGRCVVMRTHFAVLLAVLTLTVTVPARGQEHRGHEPGTPHRRDTERLTVTIPDVPVLDQDGRPRKFYSDLVRGKAVAINFMYTTCTTACPLLGVAFAGVQDRIAERVGRDVHLLSISVDPATDTPARMKAWGAQHGARAGWTLVTGARPDIVKLLRALGVTAGRKEDHPTFVLIGDDRRADWRRAWGLLPAAELIPLIEQALATGVPAAQRGDAARFAPRP